jgi:deoxyribose-phosphate aldolase
MDTSAELLGSIEHTLLGAAVRAADVEALCQEAVEHGLYGVCVGPSHVARCARQLAGSAVRIVTVIGFPLCATFAECLELEATLCLEAGAHELDLVMRLSAAKQSDFASVEEEARRVVRVAGAAPVKLILETAALEPSEKARACQAALAAGVAFVKTSTGFGPGGATVEDVALLRRLVGTRAGVKASGGIRTLAQARAMRQAGADRIGTSASVAIAQELRDA